MSLIDCPKDILKNIFNYCDWKSLYALLEVSQLFSQLLRVSKVWSNFEPSKSTLHLGEFDLYGFFKLFKINENDLEKMSEYQIYRVKILLKYKKNIRLTELKDKKEMCLTLFKLNKILYPGDLNITRYIDIVFETIQYSNSTQYLGSNIVKDSYLMETTKIYFTHDNCIKLNVAKKTNITITKLITNVVYIMTHRVTNWENKNIKRMTPIFLSKHMGLGGALEYENILIALMILIFLNC
jgi:hypothetical protein